MLKLVNLKLSDKNDNVVECEDGLLNLQDGIRRANISSDNRKYIIAEFQKCNNPFSPKRSKIIIQNTKLINGETHYFWFASSPRELEQFLNKDVEGCYIKTFFTKPYIINDKEVSTYTGVFFEHENPETVLNNQNIEIERNIVTNFLKKDKEEILELLRREVE